MDELKDQLDKIDTKQALMVGILIAVLYYFAAFDDGRRIDYEIAEAQKQIAADRATLAKVEKALQDKKRFESEIREITNHMKEFQEYFPLNFSGNTLEAKVTEFSQKYGLTVINLKQLPIESEFKNYPETTVEFVVEGEFHNIMNFVSEITKLKKAMDFKDMNFKVSQQADDPKIKFRTKLTVYGNTDGFGAENG
ncbi:MAG: type 4a pilus biogenesis protein PilO [Bdellovibrionales bacterium]|nr:type 4a pilus biogenesis protein PilO [Bdellovibrionales bacterium]NQZ18142.1 type 4a pilus biogenesis protein PilO [Bdellovibrionales bacterium]